MSAGRKRGGSAQPRHLGDPCGCYKASARPRSFPPGSWEEARVWGAPSGIEPPQAPASRPPTSHLIPLRVGILPGNRRPPAPRTGLRGRGQPGKAPLAPSRCAGLSPAFYVHSLPTCCLGTCFPSATLAHTRVQGKHGGRQGSGWTPRSGAGGSSPWRGDPAHHWQCPAAPPSFCAGPAKAADPAPPTCPAGTAHLRAEGLPPARRPRRGRSLPAAAAGWPRVFRAS